MYAVTRRGLGDMTYSQEVNTGAQLAQSGVAVTVDSLLMAGTVTGPVGALIGAAAAALIEVGSLIAGAFQGCGETCTWTSDEANKVGDYLLQNLRAYTAAPYDPQLQTAALNNFDTAWPGLLQACGQSSLGTAGQNCIGDRQRGACTWKASPGGWVADPSAPGGYSWTDWGAAGSGDSCWNYFVGFRDPIANDPRASAVGSIVNSVGSIFNSLPISPLWIGLGLIGLGLAFSGGNK